MAYIQSGRNILRRLIKDPNLSSSSPTHPLLFVGQGLRYRKLEVILTTSIEKLGKAGETVKVAPGYFRNHLMPKLLAVPNIEKYAYLIREQRKYEDKKYISVLTVKNLRAVLDPWFQLLKKSYSMIQLYEPEETEIIKVVPVTKEDTMKEYQTAAKRLDNARLVLRRMIVVNKESSSSAYELRKPVTKDELVAEVARQLSVAIEPENIYLPEPLSAVGTFEVPLLFPRKIPLPEGKTRWTLDVKVRAK